MALKSKTKEKPGGDSARLADAGGGTKSNFDFRGTKANMPRRIASALVLQAHLLARP